MIAAALIALSLAGLAVPARGSARPWGRAWCVVGLAGAVLLLPSLLTPDAVPSPAGALQNTAPWQGTITSGTGNPELRDITFQVQPWLLYTRQELRAGRIPWWNPHQYAGAPFYSNGSAAPLFPLHLLFAALPLRWGFLILPWLRIVIGGLGAWHLGRRLGLGEPAARVAAVAFPLSGMLAGHVLFPMANALMLVPWILEAVEAWASRERGWTPIAWLGALQLIAGHPETALHTCLACAVFSALQGTWRDRP